MKYMMKCTLFTCAESALVSDSLSSLRFSFLCITHTMTTICFFHHMDPFVKDSPFSQPSERKYPSSLTVGQNEKSLTTVCLSRSTDSPYVGSQISTPGAPAAVGMSWSPGEIEKKTDVQHLGRWCAICWLRIKSTSSSSAPNTHQGGGLDILYKYTVHADVYLLSSSGKLSWTDCVSLALTHRCWHIDRWVASCPSGLPLMASMRMDGLIFKVQLVISQPAAYLLSDLLA